MTAALTTTSIHVGNCNELSNQLYDIVEILSLLRIIPTMLIAAAIRIKLRLARLYPSKKIKHGISTKPITSTKYQIPHPLLI